LKDTINSTYGDINGKQLNFLDKILSHGTWWTPNYDPLHLTFNDIIKGIVPMEMSNLVHNITNNKSAALEILGILFDRVYVLSNQFWKDRCLRVLHKEKSKGITSKQKKAIALSANNYKRSYYVDHDIYDNLEDTIEGSALMDRIVTFNSHFTNFWRSLDFFFLSVTNKVRFLRLI
jgi:hypothetical protein